MTTAAPSAIISMRVDDWGLAGAVVEVEGLKCPCGSLDHGGHAPAGRALDVAAELMAGARKLGRTVSGLALAAPSGDLSAEILGAIPSRFGLRVTRDALMPAAMRGEQIRGGARGRSSAVLFDTDRLAVGMVLNGRILRGAHGFAGNLAHTSIDPTGGIQCRCGKMGCLAAMLATGPNGPGPALPGWFPPMPSRRCGWLALAAVHLINTVNPAALIVGGEIARKDADFAWLSDAVERGGLATARAGLQLISRARPANALIGAAAHFLATTDDTFTMSRDSGPENSLVEDAVVHS